jgi:dihydroorotase
MSLTDTLDVRPGPDAHVILRNATVLDPVAGIDGQHDVVVRDGRVAELAAPGAAAVPEGAEVIEAEGLHAFPAFFDPHVHLRTPGHEHKEDVETGTRAAAAGGYCGVLAMANTEPPVSTAADVTALREQARAGASVPVGFLATVTKGMRGEELTEMVELREAGAIGFSDDGLPIRSANVMRRALQYQHLCGGNIALHEEEPTLSGDGVMHEGPVSAAVGLAGIPSVSESTMVTRDAALARYERARIHVQHLSAAESVEAVAAAKAAGVEISAEASPHHLVLTDEEIRGTLDPHRFKMNPPLRWESDRQALIAGLRDGTIECVATDHAPHQAEEKEVPFEQAAMGVTGLETAFAALHTELVIPGVIGLGLLVERLAGGAAPFGIERPTLAPGSEANVVLCDLGAEWTVGEDGYESRSQNSWCAGRTLTGRVLITVAAGQVAFRLRSFSLGVAA